MLIKSSLIYLISSVINKGLPFILLPILTKYLTPEEYGIVAMFQLSIIVFYAFVGMNSSINIDKNFHRYNKKEISNMLTNIILLITASLLTISILTFIFLGELSSLLNIDQNWIMALPIIGFMLMINTINLSILRNQNKPVKYGIFEISNTAINVLVTLTMLMVYNSGWESQAFGIVAAYFVFFCISVLFLIKRNYLSGKFSLVESKRIINISIPLIPHLMATLVIAMSDRIFIAEMIGMEMVGVYSAGYTFGMIVLLFTDAFSKVWGPWFFKQMSISEDKAKEKIVTNSILYMIGICILTILIVQISLFIMPLMLAESYHSASEFIIWVSIGYAIHGIYKLFFPYMVHINKTILITLSTVVAAAVNILFNYIFILEFGAIGAAYATILAFSVSSLMLVFFQMKYYPMPWKFFSNN
jgi:O-antigen/teichoic acid export membrane protein